MKKTIKSISLGCVAAAVLFTSSHAFAGKDDVVGIHHFSEYGKYINKKLGWDAESDSEEYSWDKSATVQADSSYKVEGTISYKFDINKGWSRWVLKMKGKNTVDFSPYKKIKFAISSDSVNELAVIFQDLDNNHKKIPLKDLGFKKDGKFHTITVKTSDLKKAGIDLKKINTLIQISWGGIQKGSFFNLDDLHLEK
ncbi:MAG: hypothetical protein MK193_11025 [Lentisphaeria bacterium]|nr:hypothetical protein [Lentisphaeria bacterium]